jgi:hypothetical protein
MDYTTILNNIVMRKEGEGGQVVEMHGQCNCIMIIRTCNEELIKEAIKLGADEARCEGDKLIVMWSREEEPPCSLKCLVMQTMGEVIKKA